MRIHKLVLMVALASAALAVHTTSQLQAQQTQASDGDAKPCDLCGESNGGTMHDFWATGCVAVGSPCYDCHAFNACHTNSQTGTCSAWHWGCQTTGGEELEITPVVWSGIAKRVARGERAYVTSLAASHTRVVLNEDRNLVQLLSCKGLVIAQAALGRMPVATTQVTRVAWVAAYSPTHSE